MKLTSSDWLEIVREIGSTIEREKDNLSHLDAAIGDGDHGPSMARGFRAVTAKLPELKDKTVDQILATTGMTITSTVGGATGPLFGTIFIKAGMVVKQQSETAAQDMARMFKAAADGVCQLGKTKVGEKTMVDALAPAADAFGKAVQEGKDIVDALESATAAAKSGAESTTGMLATKGRARYLGEQAIGHEDAGANSVHLIFRAMLESVKNRKGDLT